MNKRIILILIIFALNASLFNKGGLTQSALGQDVLGETVSTNEFLPNKMDLASAVKYSLKHNNNIRAMRNALSATERDIGIERSDMLPKLKAYENFTVTNNPVEAFTIKLNQTRATPADLAFGRLDFPGATTNFLTSGVIEQRILDPKAMIEIRMAQKAYSANGYFYLRKQEELVHQVAQAYLKVNTDQEYVEVAKLGIKDAKEHVGIAEERFKNKGGLDSDVSRAKSALAVREQRLVAAKRNLDVAKRGLGLLLGLETPVDTSAPIPDMQLKDINFYKKYSVYRNDIKATEIKVENAKNNVKHAQADWSPTLNAIASYNLYNSSYPFGAQGSNYIAAAFLKWEPFDGNKRKYEILKAKDKEAEAKEYLEEIKKTVNFKVYEMYSNVEEHQKNLEFAIAGKKEAEEADVLIEKRWSESQLPFVSIIDAQDALDKARIDVVKNKFDLQEDLITLSYESGIIYQELTLK